MNEFEQRVIVALEDIARELADTNSLLAIKFGEDELEDDPGLQVPGHPVGIEPEVQEVQPIRQLPRGFTEAGYDPESDPTDLPIAPPRATHIRFPALGELDPRRKPRGTRTDGGVQRVSTGEYGKLGPERKGCLRPYVQQLRSYATNHTYNQTHQYARNVLGIDCGYYAVRDLLQGRTYKQSQEDAR